MHQPPLTHTVAVNRAMGTRLLAVAFDLLPSTLIASPRHPPSLLQWRRLGLYCVRTRALHIWRGLFVRVIVRAAPNLRVMGLVGRLLVLLRTRARTSNNTGSRGGILRGRHGRELTHSLSQSAQVTSGRSEYRVEWRVVVVVVTSRDILVSKLASRLPVAGSARCCRDKQEFTDTRDGRRQRWMSAHVVSW